MTNRLSLEELFNRIFELVLTDFSDIVADAQSRFTSSGAIERLRIFLKDESFVGKRKRTQSEGNHGKCR